MSLMDGVNELDENGFKTIAINCLKDKGENFECCYELFHSLNGISSFEAKTTDYLKIFGIFFPGDEDIRQLRSILSATFPSAEEKFLFDGFIEKMFLSLNMKYSSIVPYENINESNNRLHKMPNLR